MGVWGWVWLLVGAVVGYSEFDGLGVVVGYSAPSHLGGFVGVAGWVLLLFVV